MMSYTLQTAGKMCLVITCMNYLIAVFLVLTMYPMSGVGIEDITKNNQAGVYTMYLTFRISVF